MSPPSPPWEDVSASQIPGAEAPFSRAGGPGADSGLGVEWGEGCKGVSFRSAAPALNSQSRANPDRDSHRGDGERRGDLHPVTHPSTAYSPAGVGRGSWSPSAWRSPLPPSPRQGYFSLPGAHSLPPMKGPGMTVSPAAPGHPAAQSSPQPGHDELRLPGTHCWMICSGL